MLLFNDWPQFTPDLTPCAILTLGAFGGTYFRPIFSSVTNTRYENVYSRYKLICNLPRKKVSTSFNEYDVKLNLFKIKCGASLQYWEQKGWIKPIDPYGWFQWYCEFYEGRRSEDDRRQIKRWLNRKNIYRYTNKTAKIRQVWLHWGIL